MKYINNKYQSIDSSAVDFNVEKHWSNMVLFLKSVGVKDDILAQVSQDFKNAVVEILDDDKYVTKYNNEITEQEFPRMARAAATYIEQERVEDGFKLTPGVILRDKNIRDLLHVFTHESFHMFAIKTNLPYDDRGINYSKCGTRINYYNQDDIEIDSSLSAKGLDEGITELLTQKYMGGKDIKPYEFQTIIARIITRHDRSLINAYFSRDESVMKEFYNDFEVSQNFINSEDLINMSENIIVDDEERFSLLQGAMAYDLAHTPKDKIDKEIAKLKEIVHSLDKSIDYNIEGFSYTKLVDDMLISSRIR